MYIMCIIYIYIYIYYILYICMYMYIYILCKCIYIYIYVCLYIYIYEILHKTSNTDFVFSCIFLAGPNRCYWLVFPCFSLMPPVRSLSCFLCRTVKSSCAATSSSFIHYEGQSIAKPFHGNLQMSHEKYPYHPLSHLIILVG